ncbi:MAG: FecR domain-containing protein, partial [Bacteroidales bacterium]|nr:FecR domain-containing protein [Bacteroidales bacterium]
MLRIQKNNIDKWKLLLKVLSDELPENDSYFQRWLNEDPANKSLYKSLKEGQGDDALFDKEQVFRNISNKLSLNTTRKTGWHQTKWFKYATSAVAIVTLFIIAIYHVTREPHLPEVVEKTIFDPGSKKAYLLSMEGEMTDLSQSFEVKKEDGTIISNKSEGVISFEKTASVKRKIEQQTIYVPKSGEYELLLSDGTRVYLNSESRLTFPSYFEGETRQVELQGEAYFEVKKGGKPFVILTPELTVEVLGTSFNINAYETNPYVNTTLVEGNVRVHLAESRK